VCAKQIVANTSHRKIVHILLELVPEHRRREEHIVLVAWVEFGRMDIVPGKQWACRTHILNGSQQKIKARFNLELYRFSLW